MMDDENVMYELQPMFQLEVLHLDGKEMVDDEEIWIGLDLFAGSTRTTSGKTTRALRRRLELEDALQSSSFENTEIIVEEKQQALGSAGPRRILKLVNY
jgi:hypothetical protein